MTDLHLIVGAGPVGRATALHLVEEGHDVRLASRSGAAPAVPGATRVAADATDADGLVELAQGAAVIYNCINPPSYDVWPTYWPPIASALLAAAEKTGAVLAITGNLYPYGPVDVPMTEDLPDAATGTKGALRAQMWADAKAMHDLGRIRAVEVRGSDYMGPGVETAHIPMVAARALKGRSVRVFGDPTAPHAMTDVRDVARALVAAAAAPSAHGRAWLAPTNPARSQADTVADVCRSVGHEPVRVKAWPGALLSVGGLVVPMLRELRETAYQFQRPYLVDSGAIERELGLAPTPWDEVCRATAETALAG